MKKNKKITSDFICAPEDLLRINGVVQHFIDHFPEEIPQITISDYAESNRVLPTGTPFPGPFRNALTPYMVEIVDNLSVRSQTEEVVFMKAAQIGATASIENAMAYYIDVAPGPILYATAKEDLAKKWAAKRLNPLIQSCHLEEKIFKQHQLARGRHTGNTALSKEFPGGSLDIVSAQSESNLRMDSIRYLILDEAEAYPYNVEGMGDVVEIARARTSNWGSRKRIFIPSTPGVEADSRMWPLYQSGDRRRYFLPCPFCSKLSVPKFHSEPSDFYEGIDAAELGWHAVGGVIEERSVHLVCPHCGAKIPEAQRYSMVQNGKWIATAVSTRPAFRSYHIGRLCSLMDTWARLARVELQAQTDHLILQAHHNLNCGIPFREVTQKPDIARIYELRGSYNSGEIPSEEVLFLTAAIDVQAGKANDPSKPARLEMEVCGHGYAYKTWSLQYKVFEGAVDDPYGGAWQALYDYALANGFACRRSDGVLMQPRLVFIDSGDGNKETTVFDFCTRTTGFIPIKGVAELKQTAAGTRTDIVLDERGPRDRDRFREHHKHDQMYISIFTAWYKNHLWRALKIARQPDGNQRPRFCEFPRDYPDRYFDMLVAEERRPDGSFWRPESRANESLDLRIYNMAAADYWLYLAVQAERTAMIRAGWTREQAERLQSRHIIDKLIINAKRKPVNKNR